MSLASRNTASRRPAQATGPNWQLILVWFLRMLALGWIISGLWFWAAILGVEYFDFVAFETRSRTYQAVTIFYAVIDLVAAVGLWSLASWGIVVWFISAASKIALSFVVPAALSASLVGNIALGGCILLLLGLLWLASRKPPE